MNEEPNEREGMTLATVALVAACVTAAAIIGVVVALWWPTLWAWLRMAV